MSPHTPPRPPPRFYVAALGASGEHVHWFCRDGVFTTTDLVDAALLTEAEVRSLPVAGAPVPGPVAAHLAIVTSGKARVVNHPDTWTALGRGNAAAA